MTKDSWKLSIFILLLGNIVAIDSDACSCMSQPIEEDFAASDAVFIGKVTQVSELFAGDQGFYVSTQRATFEVYEQFKGPVVQAVTFEAIFPVSAGTCGYPMFYAGETFLVWAKGNSSTGYTANALDPCSRTGPAASPSFLRKILNDFSHVDER